MCHILEQYAAGENEELAKHPGTMPIITAIWDTEAEGQQFQGKSGHTDI